MLQNFIFETIATESDDVTKVTNFYFSQFLEFFFYQNLECGKKEILELSSPTLSKTAILTYKIPNEGCHQIHF